MTPEQLDQWRCFHCDEVFTDRFEAARHFGADESATTACQIKGAEGGLVRALRDAEAETEKAYRLMHDESNDFAKAFYAAQTRHQQALLRAEELGYERGLDDGRRLVREDVRPDKTDDDANAPLVAPASFATSQGPMVGKPPKPETSDPVAWMLKCPGEIDELAWNSEPRLTQADMDYGWTETPLYTHPPQTEVVEALEKVAIPAHIAEQVLAMGRAYWGATGEKTASEHMADFENTLRLTRENFNCEDVPVAMHGLYLEGTETVLCHTGTSPNSGANAQVLTGAWNWLYDQCATLKGSRP